ncbi:uncharacterized protein LOC5512607 isoform X1 [Nematostella vectensis]|uniref:uncharacterized protein LOC5512607 isoform X1 n=1 Tax=Nematostella vectensis TaxID=45351 RepID=UPI0020774784|nr:uncharacterized protein LOC5512607 isoform X1 [Nematostella vectensis]
MWRVMFHILLWNLIAMPSLQVQPCNRSISFTKRLETDDLLTVIKTHNSPNTTRMVDADIDQCLQTCCSKQAGCNSVIISGRGLCLLTTCRDLSGLCGHRPSGLGRTAIHVLLVREHGKGNSVGELLDKVQFRNAAIVTSKMSFTQAQQCGQYVEPENVTSVRSAWVTPRFSPYSYLYRAPRRVPPLGIRSAVPLGGLGTGSFEIRADGSFNEWTLENQSPGGSAKLGRGALDLAVLGVRVQKQNLTKVTLLRTHPPLGVYPGVEGLQYSGAYPFTKLEVKDNRFFGVKLELFAHGILRARDSENSTIPAVVFTLRVRNPTADSVNVSLLLNLPLGEQQDTERKFSNLTSWFHENVTSSKECAWLCHQATRCMAWSLVEDRCVMMSNMPPHAYKRGVSSGVKGTWHKTKDSLTCERPGIYPNSGSTTIGAMHHGSGYELTAQPIKGQRSSFGVSDDFTSLWSLFKDTGQLDARHSYGIHGSGVVTKTLGPRQNGTLSLVMAWYYPFRDHSGELVGSYYSNIFTSSESVAEYVTRNYKQMLTTLISWRYNMMPKPFPNSMPNVTFSHDVMAVRSSLDPWLQDVMINSLSYWRSGFWVADGRWRQWEAFDCNDVDSVHNDFQRELPYILFYPDLLENVVRSWAEYRRDGGIPEALGHQYGCWRKTNRFDKAGGRLNMADVNPAFLSQVYHLYMWTGNKKLLDDLWPAIKHVTHAMVTWTTNGTSLPLRMTNTYDILQFQRYDVSMYNSVMHLLGLTVARAIGQVRKERKFVKDLTLRIRKATSAIDRLLWDEKRGYYRAWWDHAQPSTSALMADSLYGQVWAYTLGLGNLLDENKMASHLRKEAELNDTPFGLKVMSGLRKPKGKTHVKRSALVPQYYVLRDVYTTERGTAWYRGNWLQTDWVPQYVQAVNKRPNTYSALYDEQSVPQYKSGMYEYPEEWSGRIQLSSKARNVGLDQYHQPSRVYDNQEYYRKLTRTQGVASPIMKSSMAKMYHKRRNNPKGLNKNIKSRYPFYDNDFLNAIYKAKTFKRTSKVNFKAKKVYMNTTTARNVSVPSSNCHELATESRYKSVWMGASVDWSVLQLYLGAKPDFALSQAKKSLEHYRSGLNELWNIHGLTSGTGYGLDGQPWCTSHYTFHMVLWHIPIALSGQQYSAVDKKLVFAPKVTLPYSLPFFTPGASGTIEAKMIARKVVCKLSVSHGTLDLNMLSVSGRRYPSVVNLVEAEFVAW